MNLESVWILMDTSQSTGRDSVVATFVNKDGGMKFIANYVLENAIDTTYLHFFEQEIINRNRRATDV